MRRRTSTAIDPGVVEVDPVVEDLALDPGDLDEVVHPVEAAQHGGLAAPRRADEGGDLLLADLQRHVAHCPELAVEDAEVADIEH